MSKYGLLKEQKKPEDYVFGGGQINFETIRIDGDWTNDLPVKEFQNINNIEPYACVIFTLLNCIETLIYAKYGETRNYSDRFIAEGVNTRGKGCSPQQACEFLRKIGVPPQDIWPYDGSIKTEDQFFEEPNPEIYRIASEFNDEWDFKHEYVPSTPECISKALMSSPLLISVPAWHERSDGLFYRPEGTSDNHATTLFYERPGTFRRIFDSYDSPAIKDIDWSCMPEVIKRFWIERKLKPITPKVAQVSFFQYFINWLFPHTYENNRVA